jgi:hypothetical protein
MDAVAFAVSLLSAGNGRVSLSLCTQREKPASVRQAAEFAAIAVSALQVKRAQMFRFQPTMTDSPITTETIAPAIAKEPKRLARPASESYFIQCSPYHERQPERITAILLLKLGGSQPRTFQHERLARRLALTR